MYFKQFLDERYGCASYMIASRQSHEAAIVDPALDVEPYEALLRERDFRLRYVIDTHVHADHLSGARQLAAAHGASLCLYESAQVAYPYCPLHDGEELALGQLRLRVWHTPGHFEGPCGKGMCGRPSTTIGFERCYNPLTQLDRDAFVAAITSEVPARPLNMMAIEATNRGAAEMSWAMLNSATDVQEIDVDTLASRTLETVVVDVREPEEYEQGHVPRAINLPQAELASRLDELPHDRPLTLICRSGARSLRAAQFLRQVGFGQVANVQGGTLAWRAASKPLAFGEHSAGTPRIVESTCTHAGVLSP